MTDYEPHANDFPESPTGWTSGQLHHVETELLKEYPNLSGRLIHSAVSEAGRLVESRHGTVRMLTHARKYLAAAAMNPDVSIGRDFRLPA